ncbi:MAG: gamma-glutamyl ligase, partial [Candidatus Korarchaeota archaeon]|nr:gamma-glutamyl ligase [Candidatus Korarchaeota archaeon]
MKVGEYSALAVTTKYWRPGEEFIGLIVGCVKGKIIDGDFIVVSEKAISTAKNVVDEGLIEPSLNSRLIAKFWMRMIWGYILGPLCHLQQRLLRHLREYP